jgi:hypothetical protein
VPDTGSVASEKAALWLKRSDLVRIVEIRISSFIMMKVAA